MNRIDTLELVRRRTGPWDIVVIGGGATGVGCALDGATRGLDVLLLERLDLGKGTSSRSTKLAHGGVRYLRQGNVGLVTEALAERSLMLKNAPHVAHKLAFIVPTYSLVQNLFYSTGLKIYDLLAGSASLGPTRSLTRSEVAAAIPGICTTDLTGGVLYYDGQFDDVRLLLDIAVHARAHGASILNYAPVTGLHRKAGRINGVEFTDAETGESFGVEARVVINAAGVFCDEVRRMAKASKESLLTFSQGIHIVVDESLLGGTSGLMIPKTKDGRVLFAIPWKGRALLGTTDTSVKAAEREPVPLSHEIDFVLSTAGQYLESTPTKADIKSMFAGIRPLVGRGSTRKTSDLSRSHTLVEDTPGLVTITGGKWTTYRRMAEQAVDQAVRSAGIKGPPSRTKQLEIPPGSRASGTDEPSLKRFIDVDFARCVEDVLARRTQLLFTDARAASSKAGEVAASMAAILGRDNEWVIEQAESFRKLCQSYVPEIP